MFAVGVDEMDWDDLNDTHYDWPAVEEVKKYRNQVKSIVLDVIKKSDEKISWGIKFMDNINGNLTLTNTFRDISGYY